MHFQGASLMWIQVDMAISQFLLFWIFPQNYLRVLPSWWLASLRARSWREQDRSYSTFYDPALEVTLSLPPYSIGHKSQPWLSVRDHTGATLRETWTMQNIEGSFELFCLQDAMNSHHYMYCIILVMANWDMSGFFLCCARLLLHCL